MSKPVQSSMIPPPSASTLASMTTIPSPSASNLASVTTVQPTSASTLASVTTVQRPSASNLASVTTVPTVSTIQPSNANLHTAATKKFDAIFADPPTTTNIPPHPPQSKQGSFTHPQNNVVTATKSAPALLTGKQQDNATSQFASVPPTPAPKREPPSREVTQTHHKHHVITVDSETDFTKMHIDEKKVNYLLYNPPVAVSQTGLIQSIGKPFNPNHAKYLPDPGEEFRLTRRVSQVRLHQVCILGDVNTKIVDSLAATIKLLSTLIGILGLAFFCFVLSIAAVQTPMEYPLYFLDSHPFCKAAHIAGVVQPIVVASYCRYALINLKYIRSYFLRVPFSLAVPAGVIYCGLDQFTGAVKKEGELKKFLNKRMEHYFGDTYISRYSKNTWDGIQNSFSCCGYESPVDWKAYNTTVYPLSCCKEQHHEICDFNSTSLKSSGCHSAYKGSNIPIALTFVALGAATIGLEIFTIVLLRSLWACIGKELYDERSSLIIVGGKLCSLCDIEETDEEMEYDMPHHESSSDEDHHEGPDKNEKKLEADGTKKSSTTATSTVAHKPATEDAKTHSAPKKILNLLGFGQGKVNKVGPA